MGYRKKSFWNKQIVDILSDGIMFSLKCFQWVGEQTIAGINLFTKPIVFILSKQIRIKKPAASTGTFKVLAIPLLKLPKIRVPSIIHFFLYGFITATLIIGLPTVSYLWSKELPNPKMLSLRDIPVTTKMYDRNGEILYEIYADQNRTPITLAELPKHLVNATIAIEDKTFYRHQGFSPRGIIRALYNIVFNKTIQGGSTITQQLIRNALLSREVSIQRKIKELILSIWTEQLYTKDQILEMYFNQVPYGGTAWGVEAAAQTYFGKSVKNITLAEASLLAGLPASPTRYSPFGPQPKLAFERQREVLRRMVEDNYITERERQDAENEKIAFRRPNVSIRAPHFVMYVRDLLTERYGIRMVEQGGLRIITSLDLNLQNKVQDIVTSEVEGLKRLSVGNGAALVTNPKTGEILAMVGSTDYFDLDRQGNVNVTLTQQQPGSTMKAITYTAALQNGFTAATLLNDAPISYTVIGSPVYAPVNYDGRFHGIVPLRLALGNSYNVPAVRTLAKIGVPTLIEQARKMGIRSWTESSRYGLSLTLGGGEVTMLEMAQAYGTLANNGISRDLTPIIAVTDYLGNVLEDGSTSENQAASTEVAFIISDILADNTARTAAFGPNSLLAIPNQWVAVKTGTSNDKRDNWTIGFTKDFTVTAWVGNNDNTPMNPVLTSGITGATPIWRKTTDVLLKDKPSKAPDMPSTVVKISCRGRDEYFVKGTEPIGGCAPIPTPAPSTTPTP